MTEITRCNWSQSNRLIQDYHDKEWGMPVLDDVRQFEHLILEVFQAGLSWLTILKKRENFRIAFKGFDPVKVAEFTDPDRARLLNDAGIVRNRLKIDAAIHGAKCFLRIVDEFGSFYDFIIRFSPDKPEIYKSIEELPARTAESEALAKELKKRGFKFLGPTTCYAHMQSVGIVNDHVETCFRFNEIEALKKRLS